MYIGELEANPTIHINMFPLALRLRSAVRISFIARESLARVPIRPTFSLILILLIDNENRMILRINFAFTFS